MERKTLMEIAEICLVIVFWSVILYALAVLINPVVAIIVFFFTVLAYVWWLEMRLRKK